MIGALVQRAVIGLVSYAVAKRRWLASLRTAKVDCGILSITEELERPYMDQVMLLNLDTNESFSVRLQGLMGMAFIPGTIASSAIRAASAPLRQAEEDETTTTWPGCATVVAANPNRWFQRCCESIVAKFVRQLIEDHDVFAECPGETKARRIRSLRATTEVLGAAHNCVAPVFVRGWLGLPGGVRVRRANDINRPTATQRLRQGAASRLGDMLSRLLGRHHVIGVGQTRSRSKDVSGASPRYYWFEPTGCDCGECSPTLVYLHGGGFVIGSRVTNGEMVARIAEGCGLRTLLVEYRRSPEARFPDALIDALKGVRAVLASGVPPSRLLMGGDSAGGALVLAALFMLKRINVVPRAAILISPYVDLEPTSCYHSDAEATDIVPSCNATRKQILRELYHTKDRRADHKALVSPAAASRKQLASLRDTSILVHVGGREVLRDSICVWARRASRAGANINVTVFQDEIHAFHAFAFAPAWPDARLDLATFVNSQLQIPLHSARASNRSRRRFVATPSHPHSSEAIATSNVAASRVSRLLAIIRRRRHGSRTHKILRSKSSNDEQARVAANILS